MLAEQQHQHEFDEEDEETEANHTVVRKDDSSGAANSVHAKAVSKIKAARDLTVSKTGLLEGFSAELKKVGIWGSFVKHIPVNAGLFVYKNCPLTKHTIVLG